MSKILTLLGIFMLQSLFLVPTASAASCNLVEPNASKPIFSESDNATFIIDVGKNDEPGISSWKMEFQCGARYQQADASKNPDSKTITTTIQRSRIPGQGCEFSPIQHSIQVKAIDTNGKWKDWCIVNYNVINSDSQCKLSITPDSNLTAASTITVSGNNLTKDGQFVLFIDNDDKINSGYYVNTPSFSGITIPAENVTPNQHKLYLKRYYTFSFISPFTSNFGPPLCPLEFCVGTTSAPCGVTSGTGGGAPAKPAGLPTTAGGIPCADPKNPGFATAIGCIHTNPLSFIKDFLKFVIGISGGLAFLLMLLGAFQMITSAGNPETLQAGRDRFQSAIIGLLFVIFAVLLLQIIGVDILGLGKQFGGP